MKRIVSCACLLWLVCISATTSEQQADHHHENVDSEQKKMFDSAEDTDKKTDEISKLSARDGFSTGLKERGMDSDYSSLYSGSSEDEGMKDRGLFGDLFEGPGKRRRHRGMFSPSPYDRGYGGRGRSPFKRQGYGASPYGEAPYYGAGMGYGQGGSMRYGGQYPGGRYSGGQYPGGRYPSRMMGQYPGGRGGGRMGGGRNGGYPGAGGFYDQSPYRQQQPYYRDLPTESNNLVEPVVAR